MVDRSLGEGLEALRRPVFGYCYRMLGSVHEAEDAVQETMVRAWRGLPGLADPSGLRPWVYRIATNVCIDAAHDRRGRALPMDLAAAGDARGELGPALPEATWVSPVPSRLVEVGDPLERVVSRESVRLAFVAALQHLLPRQRAVLILRDVLCWRAAEVAALLDTSVDAVNSTVRRARAALAAARRGEAGPPGGSEPVDPRLLERYVDAFERFDIDRIVALLHQDVVVSMPPFAFWLRGREAFGTWLETGGRGCANARLLSTEANGCPAVALYRRGADGLLEPTAIQVLEWRDGRITALHAFLDPALFDVFGL
ncbi:sigma-70 family RNA polymerase sigma factor [Streptomyces capparidis]